MTILAFRVVKGALQPANEPTREAFRARGVKVGHVVELEWFEPHSTPFMRLIHVLGKMLCENREDFGTDAHAAIKRLQLESGTECDVIGINLPGFGMVEHRTPRSFAFNAMSEKRRKEAFKALCDHVRVRYWPELTEAQIEEQARLMGDAR